MGGSTSMVEPGRALPGREEKMPISAKHYVLGNPMDGVPDGFKVAVFANGCFCERPNHSLHSKPWCFPA